MHNNETIQVLLKIRSRITDILQHLINQNEKDTMNSTTLTALANLDAALVALEAAITAGTVSADTTTIDAAIQSRADSITAFVAASTPPVPPAGTLGALTGATSVQVAAARRAMLLPK